MTHSLPSIDLALFKKLRDRSYRRRFFLAESSANIAKQLIELRKRRHLTQKELAELAETGQPAISRAERADYHSWSFNTLRNLAEAMDARIRVLIEPSEDILAEYKPQQSQAPSYVPPTDTIENLVAVIIHADSDRPKSIASTIAGLSESSKFAATARAETRQQPALHLIDPPTPLGETAKRSDVRKLETRLAGAA